MPSTSLGGYLTLADDLTISRMGYGAMQLAGPGVFGPPKDRDQALAVLRAAIDDDAQLARIYAKLGARPARS